jgi:S-DNA-T family DNA segregation ATPase FtsK/SpoIIIE
MSDDVERRFETHLEVDLDDVSSIDPKSTREPVFVDVVTKDEEVRPVIPAGLRRGNMRNTVRFYLARSLRVAGYHTVRSPWYLLLAAFWAFVGVFRLAGRQLAWWWVSEQSPLRWEATKKLDTMIWMKLHKDVRQIRKTRGLWLLAELAGIAVTVVVLVNVAPRWVAAAVVVIAVPLLAHIGRPATKPIVHPAIVTPRFRKLTADIVLRAYYAAGLGHPEKPGQQVQFGSTMARDGDGSRVLVDLPYGKGLSDAVAAREKVASGLDVQISQVYFTRDPELAPPAHPVGRRP